MKKIGKLLICIMLACSFAFTGCSLVQRNTERYLNRTVAEVGELKITKQELITAYNNYGYQYVQSFGYTAEKALNITLDGLINRKIVLEKAKEAITENENAEMVYDGKVVYNKNVWQNAVWTSTFEAINSQVANYVEEINKEQNIETPTSSEEEEKTPEYKPYDEYEKKVVYEDGNWSVKSTLEPAEENALSIASFELTVDGSAEITQQAFKRYVKSLALNYKSKNLKADDLKLVSAEQLDGLYAEFNLSPSDKIAFLYEVERLHNSYDESKYLTEYQNIYERCVQVIDNSFNKKVVDYYKNLVEASYEKYEEESLEDSYSAYVSAMQEDNSKVYYHKDYGTNEKGEKRAFVAVSHVLIKLSDEQIAEIDVLKTNLSTGVISQKEYDDEYQKVLNRTVVHARDEDGFETEETKTVAEVMAEIKNDLAQYSTTEEKAIAFNKYIYKYGQDTGIINAEKYYVVNLDTTVEDKMTKNFANASRQLASEMENGGNLSEPVFVSQDNYSGYHIIFNAGIVKNDLSIEQVRNMDYTDADYLYGKKLMLGTNKTMYDFIYDKVYSSNYSAHENSLTETAKNNLVVVYYKSAYEDLY